jgi:hypothetical protein
VNIKCGGITGFLHAIDPRILDQAQKYLGFADTNTFIERFIPFKFVGAHITDI